MCQGWFQSMSSGGPTTRRNNFRQFSGNVRQKERKGVCISFAVPSCKTNPRCSHTIESFRRMPLTRFGAPGPAQSMETRHPPAKFCPKHLPSRCPPAVALVPVMSRGLDIGGFPMHIRSRYGNGIAWSRLFARKERIEANNVVTLK